MTDEERELLARIGQLAGQINRHKNQQNGAAPATAHHPHRRHNYRQASAPYPQRGPVARPRTHQHRTLSFNTAGTAQAAQPAAEPTDSNAQRWVSKTDRHRQLINANVYEKVAQTRAKAVEETRKRKQTGQRRGERARFNHFLAGRQPVVGSASTDAAVVPNEVTVDGTRFRVLAGGKKLAKIADGSNELASTPKFALVAGVKFHRTKTGNLVPNRVVQDHRLSGKIKKTNELCQVFSTTGIFSIYPLKRSTVRYSLPSNEQVGGNRTHDEPSTVIVGMNKSDSNYLGSCSKGPRCRYVHDPSKVALCKEFLKEGKCIQGEACDLSHELGPERVPNCLHFARGNCAKADCPYTHTKALPGAPVCRAFGRLGYCEKGAECDERHVFECPDFSNTGKCKTKGCKLLHRERASVLRAQDKGDESMDDVSSDEEAESDDVDSDEVAEFVDADSEVSDTDDWQDFIAV